MTTRGEYLVASFEASESQRHAVSRIKAAAAHLIDLVDDIWRDPEAHGDQRRCASLAITNIEQGAMWAVKAATKQPADDPA